MTASGKFVTVTLAGRQYVFDTLRFTVQNKTEDTPLLDGSLYRVKSGECAETIYLRAELDPGQMSSYRTLIRTLAHSVSGLIIDSVAYSGFQLLSGRVRYEKGSIRAVCEITLTEVNG